jgi:HTH-type transcriptional regulator / antitoxin HipB
MVTNMLLRTPNDLGSAIRDRRRRLNLDQSDLARQIGVSRKWIIDVEKGKPGAEIGLVLRTLDVLGLRLALDTAGENATPAVPVADIDKILDRTRDDRS